MSQSRSQILSTGGTPAGGRSRGGSTTQGRAVGSSVGGSGGGGEGGTSITQVIQQIVQETIQQQTSTELDPALVALLQRLPELEQRLTGLSMLVGSTSSDLTTHRWEPLVGGEPADPELIFANGYLIWEYRAIADEGG